MNLCPEHMKELERRQEFEKKIEAEVAVLMAKEKEAKEQRNLLFGLFREIKDSIGTIKEELKKDITDLKGFFQENNERQSRKILGLELKIIAVFAVGGAVGSLMGFAIKEVIKKFI